MEQDRTLKPKRDYLVDTPNLFVLLFEKSGFSKIKIEKSIDFKELYLKKNVQ